jgi:hypothetical protein
LVILEKFVILTGMQYLPLCANARWGKVFASEEIFGDYCMKTWFAIFLAEEICNKIFL